MEADRGRIIHYGGGTGANRIAAWNGISWSALGAGMDQDVYALTVYNGNLIAGGFFNTAGGWPQAVLQLGMVLPGQGWDFQVVWSFA